MNKIDEVVCIHICIGKMFQYRLEILPTEEGREYYKDIPVRSNDNAGFDLYLMNDVQMELGKPTLLKLGCRVRLLRLLPGRNEEEVHFWLAPRSSIWKSGVIMANSMGIIDRTYRGELMGAVIPLENQTPLLQKGSRLFQIVAPDMGWIHEVKIVESLPETSRGEGGFGSTGQ